MINNFRDALKSQEAMTGVLVTLPSPEVVEILSESGFDWLFFDLEHSAMSFETLQNLLRAVSDKCFSAVRVPEATNTYVAKALDSGAEAVIFPRISTVEEAELAVSLSKYPPLGNRGVGLSRAHRYGREFSEYIQLANDRVACILQVEDRLGVENVDLIAGVDGVDAIFVGPYDLSMNLGIPGDVSHPEVKDAIDKIALCRRKNLALGILSLDPKTLASYATLGYSLLACGFDSTLLAKGAEDVLRDFANASND